MVSENYQRVFELLLSIQQHHAKPFPQQLVDSLDSFFPGYTIVLFTGPSHELFLDSPERRSRSVSALFFQPVFSNKPNPKPGAFDQYWDRYYHEDPEQPVNLPENLRGKTVVCYSDFGEPTAVQSENFNQYLGTYGISNKATIYLYSEQYCLAGIAMCRADDKGPFTPDELELFDLIGKGIAPLYYNYLRESFYASIAEVYRTYYEPDDIALALVSARSELIEANKTALDYCAQIMEGLSADEAGTVPGETASPVSGVVRLLIRTHTPIASSIDRTLVCGSDRFHCMLKPCLLTGLSTDIHTLYLLRISKESGVGISVPPSVVKQYGLTNREKEIVDLLISGYKTEQISKALYISRSTVKNHISNIFRKMDVSSRVELMGKLNQ